MNSFFPDRLKRSKRKNVQSESFIIICKNKSQLMQNIKSAIIIKTKKIKK